MARIRNGFTLIEFLTVVVVLGIALTIAMPSFSRLLSNYRLQAQAQKLQGALMLARSEAIKRGGNVSVTSNTANTSWQGGWKVLAGTTVLLQQQDLADTALTISGTAATLAYNRSGRGSTSAVFTLSRDQADTRCIRLEVTGMPAQYEQEGGAC